MKDWIKLRKLKGELRKVIIAHEKFEATEKYKKLSKEEKQSENSAFYDLEYLPIYEGIEKLKTKKFLSKVHRYEIPYISSWNDKNGEFWEEGHAGVHFLSVNGYHKLRHAIREEQKARREAILGWIPIITAMAGLLGIITGLLSVASINSGIRRTDHFIRQDK